MIKDNTERRTEGGGIDLQGTQIGEEIERNVL